jgi:hypothetical protein
MAMKKLMVFLSCPSPGPEGSEYYDKSSFPNELVEQILGRVIGKHLYEWVESSMTPRERFRLGVTSFHPWFRKFWAPIADLMLVSSAFHDIVSRLVRIAFGVQAPLFPGADGVDARLGLYRCCSMELYLTVRPSSLSLVRQVYNKLRSLFYFGTAFFSGAFQTPPTSWEPLMNAYGNYMIASKYLLSPILSMDAMKVYEELHMHLHLCYRQGLPMFLAEDLVHAVDQIFEER